jgi:hypothetical protein
MAVDPPKAQISSGKAACLSQRVEDNAFHLSLVATNPAPLRTPRLNGGDFSEIGWEFVRGERLDVHFD